MIQAEDETLLSHVHKLTDSVWNREKLHNHWKETITVSVYNNGDETDSIIEGYHCCQPHIKSCILLSMLIPYKHEHTGDYQYGCQHITSSTDQIFYICLIQKQKWGHSGTVHQLLKD
jgi:hypothetical protein